jgi:flagellar hook assembly protein FlgD
VDVSASPTVFSPVGLKRNTTISILSRNRERLVKWVISIRNSAGVVVRSFQGYNAPPESIEWNGTDSKGRVVEPGVYTYAFRATDNNNHVEKSRVRQLRIDSPTPIELEAK